MRAEKKLILEETILFGLLGALIFGLQVAMSGLPNIEPVSLFIIVCGAVFGKKCLYPVYVYVLLDILLFGIGIWNIYYTYIWAILALSAVLMRRVRNPLAWAVLSGAFGLFFGAFCGITDIFIGGFAYAVSKWITGIPFDLLHCAGNFVLALTLFLPLRNLLEKLYSRMKKT